MHPLDNPIWESLRTSHARLAQSAGRAKRFMPEISPLAGFEGTLQDGLGALKTILEPEGVVGLFLNQPLSPGPGWTITYKTPLLQMVHDGLSVPDEAADFLTLSKADVPEMMALTALTKPGPFSSRTHELGDYIGVRENGRLIAISGERLRTPGYTEISAVCTHPDFLGRGHAKALMAVLMSRIRARKETPFLHVRQDNDRAVRLYERIGFKTRTLFTYALLRRADGPIG